MLGTIIGGYFLVRSVKRENEQLQLAQKLATELAGANAHLERLDKMKSEFVSIASHQLRSPITSVRGYVSMILEGTYGEISPKVKEILEHVSSATANMATSINDYLNISRIEAGNMKYDIVDCDLRKLVEDTIAEIMPASAEKKISLNFESKFDGSAFVKLDLGKTKQIVQNLIDNAIKYTPEGGKVAIVIRREETPKKQIFVEVTDTGMGISKEDILALFNKFERAKKAGTVNANGTGLGLYIAKQMAQAMGGDITVTSPGEGLGSTFIISFPLNGIEAKWKSGQ
jgi:signal transduction histidine kinase